VRQQSLGLELTRFAQQYRASVIVTNGKVRLVTEPLSTRWENLTMPATGDQPRQVGLRELAVSYETLLPATEFQAPSCIVYTNFSLLEPASARGHLNDLYVSRHHQVDAIELGRLPEGTDLIVIQDDDFVPAYDGLVLADQVPGYWAKDAIPEILGIPRPRVNIDGSAVLIARYGVRTWGHWLGELLPKIVCVEAAFPGKHRYILPAIIFSHPELRSFLESIWYHGIDIGRVIPVESDTIYRFSELYAVSPAWTKHKIHPGVVDLVRARMRPPQANLPRKVAFLRTESRTRNVANAQSLIDELRRRAFTTVEIGALSFADQAAIFAAAEVVVAVLGSGLTGLLYSPLGVRVLTLAPARWSDLFFFALMQNRDAKLADIRGVQDPNDQRNPARAGFVIELNELRRGLHAIGLD
jgi:capsular polysaccharide biosynthesis protein